MNKSKILSVLFFITCTILSLTSILFILLGIGVKIELSDEKQQIESVITLANNLDFSKLNEKERKNVEDHDAFKAYIKYPGKIKIKNLTGYLSSPKENDELRNKFEILSDIEGNFNGYKNARILILTSDPDEYYVLSPEETLENLDSKRSYRTLEVTFNNGTSIFISKNSNEIYFSYPNNSFERVYSLN